MEKRLKDLKAELRTEPASPRQQVCDEMSERLTAGHDIAMSMRIELFLMSLVGVIETAMAQIAEGGQAKTDQILLFEIKNTDGYSTLDSDMVIPDETVIELIQEAKIRLVKAYSTPQS